MCRSCVCLCVDDAFHSHHKTRLCMQGTGLESEEGELAGAGRTEELVDAFVGWKDVT